MADTRSEERYALTSGTKSRLNPVISPDGLRLLFSEGGLSEDIVSVDLATGSLAPFIATERNETLPMWAAKEPVMAYISDRNGPPEIWLHGPGTAERPLLAAAPSSTGERWFMGPTPSPDATRVAYTVIDYSAGVANLWISAVSGGAPVRITNDPSATEYPGSWSPDGAWFVYQAIHQGKTDLMKVKTSGEAAPIVLKADIHRWNASAPSWSPTG